MDYKRVFFTSST